MTMVVLTKEQRILLAETVRDIANIAAGAMIFGQTLGGYPFSWSIAAGGVVLWIAFVAWSIVLVRGGNR